MIKQQTNLLELLIASTLDLNKMNFENKGAVEVLSLFNKSFFQKYCCDRIKNLFLYRVPPISEINKLYGIANRHWGK